MSLRIEVKNWKMIEKDGAGKTIAGSFCVKNGDKEVADKQFNDGYGSINITIPAEIMVDAKKIDAKIKDVIVAAFGVTETS